MELFREIVNSQNSFLSFQKYSIIDVLHRDKYTYVFSFLKGSQIVSEFKLNLLRKDIFFTLAPEKSLTVFWGRFDSPQVKQDLISIIKKVYTYRCMVFILSYLIFYPQLHLQSLKDVTSRRRFGIVIFEYISHLALVFLLMT